MYKKHGRDRKANLKLQVKALVVKALEEQGLSMEPRTLMAPPGELALVGSPPEVPSSQGSTIAISPVNVDGDLDLPSGDGNYHCGGE